MTRPLPEIEADLARLKAEREEAMREADALAIALCHAWPDQDGAPAFQWDKLYQHTRDGWRAVARAAREHFAAEAAEPFIPDEAQLRAAIWRELSTYVGHSTSYKIPRVCIAEIRRQWSEKHPGEPAPGDPKDGRNVTGCPAASTANPQASKGDAGICEQSPGQGETASCQRSPAFAKVPAPECEPVKGDGVGAASREWTEEQVSAAREVHTVARGLWVNKPLRPLLKTLARVAPLFVEVERPKCGDARANAAWIDALTRAGIRVKEPA